MNQDLPAAAGAYMPGAALADLRGLTTAEGKHSGMLAANEWLTRRVLRHGRQRFGHGVAVEGWRNESALGQHRGMATSSRWLARLCMRREKAGLVASDNAAHAHA